MIASADLWFESCSFSLARVSGWEGRKVSVDGSDAPGLSVFLFLFLTHTQISLVLIFIFIQLQDGGVGGGGIECLLTSRESPLSPA